jgi:hypothetical protein
MARGNGGRRRRAGERYPCGKLRPAHDQGNDRVRAHRETYRGVAGSRAGDDLDCAIGQAHAAGLLEGTRVDGRVLMEHGKEWHRLYRATFGGGIRTRSFERIGRAEPSAMTTPTDLRYRTWAAIVAGLTIAEREVLNLVCVEHGDGWDLPPFLARLVNAWKARQRLPLAAGAGQPAPGDERKLAALKSALLAIVEGSRRRLTG